MRRGLSPGRLSDALVAEEKRMIRAAIVEMGTVTGAAKWLGVTRGTLHRLLNLHGMVNKRDIWHRN